jgi:hypothetical protein
MAPSQRQIEDRVQTYTYSLTFNLARDKTSGALKFLACIDVVEIIDGPSGERSLELARAYAFDVTGLRRVRRRSPLFGYKA